MKISRQAESEIPEFSSHELACEYFKNKYGNLFMMMSSEFIEDQKVYFYSLILDRKVFENGRKQMLKDGFMVDALDFMNSYQQSKFLKMV
ncbi:hypothetical protein ACOKXV_14865, partial [Sporosarcina psychrophila]|uniref:hypothetical protein n=1 Tax=Sporosarcina psychrophila TaxID=1476 RepID=UPI003BA267D9